MNHDHDIDVRHLMSAEYWDERYGSTDRVWSGNPNQRLVEQVLDLEPGTALDLGCGEGADAIWLASRGWTVTGVDVSAVALERAATHAADTGSEIATRIRWQRADLLTWTPPAAEFDLVSAQFMHPPAEYREPMYRRFAAAVRPGGRLLVVGHHPSDLHTGARRPDLPGILFTADEIASLLDLRDWTVLVTANEERPAYDPEGQPIIIRDAILLAERRRGG